MIKKLLFALSIILIFTQIANAEIVNLALVAYGGTTDTTNCDLREIKTTAIKVNEPKIYKGKSYGDSCTVKITKSEFKKEYSFCFLSGVAVTGPGATKGYSCDVSVVKDAWSFEGFIHNADFTQHIPRTLVCKYICMNKKDL